MNTRIAIIAKIAVSYHPWVSFGDSSDLILLNVGEPQGSVLGPFHFSWCTLSPMGMLPIRHGFISAYLLGTHKSLSRQDFSLSSTPNTQLPPEDRRASPQTPKSLRAPNETLRLLPRPAPSPEFHISEVAPSSPRGQKPG